MNQPQTQHPFCIRFVRHSAVLSRLSVRATRMVLFSLGVGFLAGPFAFPAYASQASQIRSAETQKAPPTGNAKASPQPSAKPGEISDLQSDLKLSKSGERMADALAFFAEGLAAEDESDSERAFQAYQRSLDFDASNSELAVKVAFELARRGDVPKAINLLKDSAKAAPKDFLPPLCLSQVYGKFLGKQDIAEKYALQALSLEPKNIGAYMALLEIYSATNNTKKAEAILARAQTSESPDALFWLQLAEINLRIDSKSAGDLSFSEQTKLSAILEKALSTAKEDADAITRVGDMYVLSKQLKAAIPVYHKALEIKKRTSPEEAPPIKDKLARTYLATGQREECTQLLEELIQDTPLRYDTYELLGELYNASGELKRALKVYQQALLVDRSQPGSYLRIADVQVRLKDADGAVATLTEARKYFPGLPQITYSLAVALSQAKQHALSLATFEDALLEARNANSNILGAAFYFAYGAAAEQAGEINKAVEMLKKSIELEPGTAAQAYNYLGYMWVDRGENLEEAATLIRRALDLEPENGAFLDSLGWYYYKVGDYEQAINYLQQALERLQPLDPVVLEHLGDAYAAQGKPAEALQNWKHAQSLDPENQTLKEKVATGEKKLAASGGK